MVAMIADGGHGYMSVDCISSVIWSLPWLPVFAVCFQMRKEWKPAMWVFAVLGLLAPAYVAYRMYEVKFSIVINTVWVVGTDVVLPASTGFTSSVHWRSSSTYLTKAIRVQAISLGRNSSLPDGLWQVLVNSE